MGAFPSLTAAEEVGLRRRVVVAGRKGILLPTYEDPSFLKKLFLSGLLFTIVSFTLSFAFDGALWAYALNGVLFAYGLLSVLASINVRSFVQSMAAVTISLTMVVLNWGILFLDYARIRVEAEQFFALPASEQLMVLGQQVSHVTQEVLIYQR